VRLAEQLADLRGCFWEDIGGGSFDRFPMLCVHRSNREIRGIGDQLSWAGKTSVFFLTLKVHVVNTEKFKQRLLAEEGSLTSRIHTSGTNSRDLGDGPSVREWSDTSVRDEENDGSGRRYRFDDTQSGAKRAETDRRRNLRPMPGRWRPDRREETSRDSVDALLLET
jgi:hypothetical protein